MVLQDRELIAFEPLEGPQTDLLTVPIKDILFGGARGGGKSHGALGHFASKAERTVRVFGLRNAFHGMLVRRSCPELDDIIKKAKEMFVGIAEWKEGKRTLVFSDDVFGGATLKFRHLDKDSDATKYQGHDYQWICVEEAGNFASPDPVYLLRGTLRSSKKTIINGKAKSVDTYFLLTANPGGVGHNWLKRDYVDPAPRGTPFKFKLPGTKKLIDRIFIPSLLSDNPYLLNANDGEYLNNLMAAVSGNEQLRKAWIEGDWDIIAGGMFDGVWNSDIHVIRPFQIPRQWEITRAYDWGSSKPFSIGWWATSDGSSVMLRNGRSMYFPPGTLIRIHEWYGANKQFTNRGLMMMEEDIVQGIIDREKRMGIECREAGPADHNLFERRQDTSLAVKHEIRGINWVMAEKNPGSRVTGWQHIRQRLHNSTAEYLEDAGMFIFDTCTDFIRTVPVLPRSLKNMDDVDTESEDHIGDETRYMCMHVPTSTAISRLTGY